MSWEICFSTLQHISAPLQLLMTLSDSAGGECVDWCGSGCTGLVRFPRFRAIAIEMPLVTRSIQARNGRKRTNCCLFTVQPLAGALSRLPATVNKVHVIPGFFATDKTLRRAPAREGPIEKDDASPLPNVPPEYSYAHIAAFQSIGRASSSVGARLSISLEAKGLGNMCAELMVVDNRRSAPA